jgi:hypothetical protein
MRSQAHFYAPMCAVLILLLSAVVGHAQTRTLSVTLHSINDSVVVLSDNFPDFSSLRIQIDYSFFLSGQKDFTIDTAGRSIVLSPSSRSLLFPMNAAAGIRHTLTLTYTALPLNLKTSYTRHELETPALNDSLRALIDSSKQGLREISSTSADTAHADILNNFQKSGSISRGFQVGSNRDLGLTSGFNLQFSGDVAKDVNITGALTEEQTPIQPEGTTQTLNEIDNIFIRIKAGQHFTSTLGDFTLDLNSPADPTRLAFHSTTNDTLKTHSIDSSHTSQSPSNIIPVISNVQDEAFKAFSKSTLDVISRKLIGAEATAQFNEGSVTIAGGAPRGEFTTNTIQGQEAYQGPYNLVGKNGEPAILIVAGTEHVYVDGVLQTRGEQNDYIIDYALDQVTFQPRRLITSDSRIVIDFEYSDQQYNKSLFAANVKGQLLDGALKVSTTYLREGDNQDAPLDLSLSDSDQNILANAGADPSKATKSAVTYAGVDANGRALGSYSVADTTVAGKAIVFYRYAPLDSVNALYNIAFGYAGTGKGSYVRLAIGQFQFAGPGLGDYDTLAYLPLPELHQVMAVSSSLRITNNFGLTGEYAESILDPNRFANIPSISGNAYHFGALFADTIPIFGYTEFRATERNLGAQFTPIDRIQDAEFERQYGNDMQTPNSYASTLPVTGELNREADLTIHPVRPLILEGGFGSLEEPQLQFVSSRLFGHAELLEDSGMLPHAAITIEHLPTHDSSILEQAQWDRQFGEISKTVKLGADGLTLGLKYAHEQKQATPFDTIGLAADSMTLNSFEYRSITPIASLRLGPKVTISGSYEVRSDDSVRNGLLTPISEAHTSHITAAIFGIGGFSTNIDLTVRDKRYTDSTSYAVNGGNQSTLLLRFEPRYTLANRGISAEALYEISNQRAAQLQRVFVPVPQGLGTYYYVGDLNHDGKADPNDFAPAVFADQGDYVLITVPTTQLFPTTDLKSNFRLHIDPRNLFSLQNPTNLLQTALANINSESYIKIEETSTDTVPSDIYFFRLSHFRNDSTTINGTMEIGQDFNIMENNADESYRLHYLERESAAQYNTGLEHSFQAERSIRGRFRPSFEFSNETTITSSTDQSGGDSLSVNPPHNTSSLGISTDWSYHPIGSKFDFGAVAAFSRAVEHIYDPEVTALTDAFTFRTSYALETRTRIRAQIERDELNLSALPSDIISLPYALTQGKAVGETWVWSLALDYQFGSGIVATIAYDGRNEASDLLGTSGQRVTINNARAEVRANF